MQALDNLVRIGQLKKEPPSRAEFEGLRRSGTARLKDAEVEAAMLEALLRVAAELELRVRGLEIPRA